MLNFHRFSKILIYQDVINIQLYAPNVVINVFTKKEKVKNGNEN
jgi:hypothetical protein